MTSRVGLVPLPFAGGYYRAKSRSFSDERLINWQVNYPDKPGISEYNLIPCPGIVDIPLFFGNDAYRGSCVMNGKTYAVYGSKLYRIDFSVFAVSAVDLTGATPIDNSNGSFVMIAAIKTQIVLVVPGIAGYHYTEGGSLVAISSPNFLIPDTVVSIDTYFVLSQFGTNVVFHSALNDGLTYAALDRYIVSQIQICKGLAVYRNQLYVMGDKLIVPFSNQAQAQFAFRPIPNAAIDHGLENRRLVINVRGGLVFVGRTYNSSLSIWLYSSGSPQRISTPPIDYALNRTSAGDIATGYLMQYSEAGMECVSMTVNGAGNISVPGYCYVHDFTASSKSGKPEWHERRSNLTVPGADYQWMVQGILSCYGRNLTFGGKENSIGYIDDSIGTEYGYTMRRVFNTQPFTMLGVNTKVKQLEIYTDVGVDNNSKLTLSWSDDGGYSYGNKLDRSTGAIGEYKTRVIWDQMGGFSRQRMLKIEYTGAYPRAINALMANIE